MDIQKFDYLHTIVEPLQLITELTLMKGEKVTFSSSLSAEDQVITDIIFRNHLNVEVFTLDTGRIFPETYSTLQKTLDKYNKQIKVYFPDTTEVENLMNKKGPSSFYLSTENRKECCEIRKVKPLKRALTGKTIWITGIRAEHSPNRTVMSKIEWDEANQITKIHPLLNWSNEQVWQYIKEHNVPYNVLHDKGFISIGCQPCTRTINEC